MRVMIPFEVPDLIPGYMENAETYEELHLFNYRNILDNVCYECLFDSRFEVRLMTHFSTVVFAAKTEDDYFRFIDHLMNINAEEENYELAGKLKLLKEEPQLRGWGMIKNH